MSKKKTILFWAAIGLVVGLVLTTTLRFANYKSTTVHYHANFALYVNGVRDQFKGPGFYEEVSSCHDDNTDDPHERAHMHGSVNDVIHVHARGVTWQQFFANLGYTLGDTALVTGNGTYVNSSVSKLSFILNGKSVDSIANSKIGDQDVLLINYGKDSDTTVMSRYNAIPHTAAKYDRGQDPSTCSGTRPLTFWGRLKIALGANQ